MENRKTKDHRSFTPPFADNAARSNLPSFVFAAALVLVILTSSHLSTVAQAITVLIAMLSILLLAVLQLRRQSSIEAILIIPTALSAFQNVYLLPVAAAYATTQMQLIVVVNFALALMVFFTLLASGALQVMTQDARNLFRMLNLIFVGLAVWGALMMIINGNSGIAGFASLRNLWAPILALSLGLLSASCTPPRRYAYMVYLLGIAVVSFGFFEYLQPRFWVDAILTRFGRLKAFLSIPLRKCRLTFFHRKPLTDSNFGAWWDPSRIR